MNNEMMEMNVVVAEELKGGNKMNNLTKEEVRYYLEVLDNILVAQDEEYIYFLKKYDDFLSGLFGVDDSYSIIKISRKEDSLGLEINSLKNRIKYAYHYICRKSLEQTADFEVDVLKRLGSLDAKIMLPELLGKLPEKKWIKTTVEKVGLSFEPYEEMEESEKEYLSRYINLSNYTEEADKLPVWEFVPSDHTYLNAATHRDYSVLAVQKRGTKRPFLVKVPFGTIEERSYGIEYDRSSSFGEESNCFFIQEQVSRFYMKRGESYPDNEYSLNHYLTSTLEGKDTSFFYLEEETDTRRYQLNKKEIVVSCIETTNGGNTLKKGKTHYSDVVMAFFNKLNYLSKDLDERVSQFLRDSLSSELKRELTYFPNRITEIFLMTLLHYPNYIWVMKGTFDSFTFDNLNLNWTTDIKNSPLMKKAEFLNLFFPKLGKKGCRRIASQITVEVAENRYEEYSLLKTAFINRQLELNNLIDSNIVGVLPLLNQFEGGPDFLTVEKWMEKQGIMSRFSFLCNKVYASSTGVANREEVRILKESVSKLLEIYNINEEYSISHLAEEKKIQDFYNVLSVTFDKVDRNISDSPYDYNHQAKSLEQKGSKFSIELPFSPAKIVDMGDKLSICVGGDDYLSRHNSGAYHVLSLKEDATIIGCIEINGKEVLQLKLKHNKVINEDKKQEELSSFVQDWINKKELIISTRDLSNLDGQKQEQEYDLPF